MSIGSFFVISIGSFFFIPTDELGPSSFSDWLFLKLFYGDIFALSVAFVPQVIIFSFAKEKVQTTLAVLLLFVGSVIIALAPLIELQNDVFLAAHGIINNSYPGVDLQPGDSLRTDLAGVTYIFIGPLLPLILLSVAPAKAVSRRLIFLALGLLLLIGLNELSKLGLDVTAPKL